MSLFNSILSLPRVYKRIITVLIDSVFLVCAFGLALLLRLDSVSLVFNYNLYDMLCCFLGDEKFKEYLAIINEKKIEKLTSNNANYKNILELFDFNGDIYLRNYVKSQYSYIQKYWKSYISPSDNVGLIDTGWSGTIVFYFKLLFPSYNIQAFFIGKSTYNKAPSEFHKDVHGIMFDTAEFVIGQGFSYLIENRHIIESIFEPKHPSTESYILIDDIVQPNCGLINSSDILGDENSLFFYIYKNINDIKEISYLPGLKYKILCPSKSDLDFYLSIERSADFGKNINVSLLSAPSVFYAFPQKIRSVKSALWLQGQVVSEFGFLGRLFLFFKYYLKPFFSRFFYFFK